MTINRDKVFQLFKYAIYAFLAMNVYWFFIDEFASAKLQFPAGVALGDMIEAYAATIDTVAWVVLLLMFELETYTLDDEQFTPAVTWSLHGLRAICYVFIVYAFYGYIVNVTFFDAVATLAGVSDLCSLAADQWSYAVSLDDYSTITAANCSSFSSAEAFLRLGMMQVVVDAAGFEALIGLAWIDVINSGVWLLVVLILEIDVYLQEHNRYAGLVLHVSSIIKAILYATLLYAAVYWGIKGSFVDFWDALLWLIAFVIIELNVFEWQQESLQNSASPGANQESAR